MLNFDKHVLAFFPTYIRFGPIQRLQSIRKIINFWYTFGWKWWVISFCDYLRLLDACSYDVIGRADRFGFKNFCSPGNLAPPKSFIIQKKHDKSNLNYLNNWAATWQNQQNECEPCEDSDQPGHPPSLIRVFAVSSMSSYGPVSSCGQRRHWSDWADAQADLRLCWAHTHFVGLVMLRLNNQGFDLLLYCCQSWGVWEQISRSQSQCPTALKTKTTYIYSTKK